MKKIVRCAGCASCAVVLPCGFTSVERHHCTVLQRDVRPDDGCTFGARGQPMSGTQVYDIDVRGDAAAWG